MAYSLEGVQRYATKIMCMIRFADDLRKLGTDPTLAFGCTIFPLDCSRVLSIGYNGAPRGFPHERPKVAHNTSEGSGMCHAELNALTKLDTYSAPPCILFIHRTPCARCAGQIINAGPIIGVIHEDVYEEDSGSGLALLEKSHVDLLHRRHVVEAANSGVITSAPILKRWMQNR